MAVRVALDIQVLQTAGRRKTGWPGWPGWPPGSTLLGDIQAWVARYAAVLAAGGRLAGALLAPEYPPPPDRWDLLDRLVEEAKLSWYDRAEVRRLLERTRSGGHDLVLHVPAPFLDADGDDPAGRVVTTAWADAGVPRVVTVHDLDPLEDPDAWFSSPAGRARYEARAEWVAASDLIVAATAAAAEQAVRLLGCPAGRVLGPEPGEEAQPGEQLVERILSALEASCGAACTPGGGRNRLPLRLALVGPFPPHGGGIGTYNGSVLSALVSTATPAGEPPVVDAVSTSSEGWGRHGWEPPEGVVIVHPDSLGADTRPSSYDALVHTVGNSSGHLVTVEAALRNPGWLWLHETRLPALATTALADKSDEEFARRMAWLLERAYPGRPPLAAAQRAGRSHLALVDAGVGLTAPLVAASKGVLVNSTAARNFLLLDLPPMAWHPPVRVLPPGCPPLRERRAGGRRRPVGDDGLAVAFGVVSMSKRPDLLVDAVARAGWRLAFVGPCPPILDEVIHDRALRRGIPGAVEVVGEVDEAAWWGWMDRATVAVQLRERSSGEISAAVLDALSAGVPVVTNLASVADYPPGTVLRLPSSDPDVEEVAAALEALSAEPAALEKLSWAGQDYAGRHQMQDLARALLEAVSGR